MEEDEVDGADRDENTSLSARVKRPKKTKVAERIPEEPTRRMASRAAKAKTAVYKDAETSEEEEEED
ncbi:hypothetical protein BGZ54_004281 [Gamsiella multidivaricata]|nr:hypothetical protein BGZ54_004281 [Gamsiella multidivaricata]